jgi:hypothetical protein
MMQMLLLLVMLFTKNINEITFSRNRICEIFQVEKEFNIFHFGAITKEHLDNMGNCN